LLLPCTPYHPKYSPLDVAHPPPIIGSHTWVGCNDVHPTSLTFGCKYYRLDRVLLVVIHITGSLNNVYIVASSIIFLRAVSGLPGPKSVARDSGPSTWAPAFGPQAVSGLPCPKSIVRDLGPRVWAPAFGPQDLGPRICAPGFELRSLKPGAHLGSPVPDGYFGSTGKELDLIGSKSIGSKSIRPIAALFRFSLPHGCNFASIRGEVTKPSGEDDGHQKRRGKVSMFASFATSGAIMP
jgi:hypothetical protein